MGGVVCGWLGTICGRSRLGGRDDIVEPGMTWWKARDDIH